MTDTNLSNDVAVIESFSKVLAVAVGILYLLGFLTVACYLSRYGVSSFSVLQLQYLIAGVWVAGPPAVHASLTLAARRFEEHAAPDQLASGKFNWRRLMFAMSISPIPLAFFFALLLAIPNITEGLYWGILLRFGLFYIAIVDVAQLFGMSRRVTKGKDGTWWLNRTYAAPFYFTFLVILVLSYTVWFGVRIYPLIPFSLGGGKPLTVAFIEGDKKMPDEIQKVGPGSKRSIPYKLLLSTDRSYVVISPSPTERSVEISRDDVAGIVVLK